MAIAPLSVALANIPGSVRRHSARACGNGTCDGTLYGTWCIRTCDVIRLHALEEFSILVDSDVLVEHTGGSMPL